MKGKLFTKHVAMLMLATCILSVAGCNKDDDNSRQLDSHEETSSESVTDSYDNKSYMTTEGFYPISSIANSYILEMKYMEDDESFDKGTVYGGKTYSGEYTLTSGEKDTIFIADYEGSNEAYIEINGIKKDISVDHIEAVGFADIDERDEYKEIVLYDLGASADPSLRIFRFCDNTIYDLGVYSGNDYNDILFDKKGRIIEDTGYIDFVDPQVISDYFEVINNEATSTSVDYSAAMNKTYKLSKDLTVAFCETDSDNLEEAQINLDNLIELKAGQEIKLLKIDLSNELYYVELPDGRRGVFTTHLAG